MIRGVRSLNHDFRKCLCGCLCVCVGGGGMRMYVCVAVGVCAYSALSHDLLTRRGSEIRITDSADTLT